MSDKRYTGEFKQEAIKQIIERGHSVADVPVGSVLPGLSPVESERRHFMKTACV